MGCWNGACGMSQLPIHYNDKVKLVFLKKSPYFEESILGSGFCYSHHLFEAYYLPISGKYNDYGSLEDIKDPEDKHFNNIKKALKIDNDTFKSFEDFITEVSRNNVPDLSFVFIHEDLYYKCIEVNSKRMTGYGETEDTLRNFIEPILADYLVFNPSNFTDYGIYSNSLPYLIKHNRWSPTFNQPEVKDLVDFYIFQDFMEEGRKFWCPQGSAGSQSSDYSVAILLGEYAKEKLKEYTDEYGEEE